MKKQLLLTLAIYVLAIINSYPQQASWGGAGIVSPEIKDNNIVTFRLQAPHARKVEITGDWMPMNGWMRASESMSRDENGVWSYTTPVLPSDLYCYSFIVDSLTTNDPNNVYLIRDVAAVTNFFIVNGMGGDEEA